MNFVENSKGVTEIIAVTVDFLSRLQNKETVQTYSMSMSLHTGEDSNPADMLVSQHVSRSRVITVVQGGIPGNVYQLSVAARTSDNNIYVNQTFIAVLEDNAVTPAEP